MWGGVCRQVVYGSIGSRKSGLLGVGGCRHVLAGWLGVGRFKKNCVGVCRCVASGVGRLGRCVSVSEKNCALCGGVWRQVSAGGQPKNSQKVKVRKSLKKGVRVR